MEQTAIIPVVPSALGWKDILGGCLARWGVNRMSYIVKPGLYRVGGPGAGSPVLVTANYKMTFDVLRKNLAGRDAWILVLDTGGINVWCAAGKGTFGTEELVNRVRTTGLADLVDSRFLILPQLGAAGVAAHTVAKETGFRVLYGPVRAADIPRFLDGGMKKNAAMRRVEFRFADRLALVPMELAGALKVLLPVIALLFIPAWIFHPAFNRQLLIEAVTLSGAVLAGSVIFPILLPLLPFRPFSAKGALLGLAWSVGAAFLFHLRVFEAVGAALLLTALTSFITLNFTGSTTFTTLPGVKKEVSIALPVIIASAAAGLALKVLAGLKIL